MCINRNKYARLLLWNLFCFCTLPFGCGGIFATEAVNVDELPHKILALPNGTRSTIIIYNEHNWREVDVSILSGGDTNDRDVCFESKFDSAIAPDRIKLFGSPAVLILNDRVRFKTLSTELKRNDNVWFAGEIRKSKDGKSLELNVIHVFKQPPDQLKYEQRLAALEKNKEFDALIELGHKIEQLRTGGTLGGFEDFDKLDSLKNKAFETGLTLKEASLKRDDADGLFTVAMQWKELLRKNSQFRTLVERVLKIDPNHPRAQRFTEELGLVKFKDTWRSKEDVAAILKQIKDNEELASAEQKAALEAHQKELTKAVEDRPILLHRLQMALRASDPQASRAAVANLGEAISQSPDAGFGHEAVEILTNLSAEGATAGLERATHSKLDDVRGEVYESLVWRGSQNQPASFEILARALKDEKNAGAAGKGVQALVALAGKSAAGTLVTALDAKDPAVCDEIMAGLKSLTQQSFNAKEDWREWWNKNKDIFK